MVSLMLFHLALTLALTADHKYHLVSFYFVFLIS